MIPQFSKNKQKGFKEFDLADYIKNGWEFHYGHQLYVGGRTVHLSCAIKNGTSEHVFTLPEVVRPTEVIYFPTSLNDSNKASYISITSSGNLNVSGVSVGKMVFINVSYHI